MDLGSLSAQIAEFVRANQSWAPVIVGALAFGESVAVLSLFVPSTVLLLGIGALVGASGIAFWPIWLAAALGAIAGDWVSYAIGYRFKHAALGIWPLSRHPDMAARGETFFARWGAWGLFAGRFFGPVRAVLPLIAGVFAMPFGLFQAVNTASAFVWAFAVLAPGAGIMAFAR